MGRPKGGRNTHHSKEEKIALVLRNLEGETTWNIRICPKTKKPETEGAENDRYTTILNREFYAEKPM